MPTETFKKNIQTAHIQRSTDQRFTVQHFIFKCGNSSCNSGTTRWHHEPTISSYHYQPNLANLKKAHLLGISWTFQWNLKVSRFPLCHQRLLCSIFILLATELCLNLQHMNMVIGTKISQVFVQENVGYLIKRLNKAVWQYWTRHTWLYTSK